MPAKIEGLSEVTHASFVLDDDQDHKVSLNPPIAYLKHTCTLPNRLTFEAQVIRSRSHQSDRNWQGSKRWPQVSK